ncbi:hypothetical protein DITRI_Ditri06bG0177500 [Diplodiscus trichospermus]
MPFLANSLVQLGYAGLSIMSKLAMESGMKPFVLVAYRQIFATIAIAHLPFSWSGLENSHATIACALENVSPAATFILAALCRQEAVGIKKAYGQAKVLGTLMCVGGAMVLSFLPWTYYWHSIQCTAIGIFSDHSIFAWSLSSSIRLIVPVYAVSMHALWFRVGKENSNILPPLLVYPEKRSFLCLCVHSVVGSLLIVGGLYVVLWGNDREIKLTKSNEIETGEATLKKAGRGKDDLEQQLHRPEEKEDHQTGGA